MAFLVGKHNKVFHAQFDLSSYFNSVESDATVDTHDSTTFGNDSMTYIPGTVDGTLTIEGYFDGSTDGVDEEIEAALGVEDKFLTICLADVQASADGGSGSIAGNRCHFANTGGSAYNINTSVSGIATVTAAFQADGGIAHGVALDDYKQYTTTTQASSIDNGASSANGAEAHIHVIDATGTTPTLDAKIEDSANDSTWADLITFTQFTAAGSQRGTVTGTVDRYVRLNLTIGGTSPTFDVFCSFARL